MFSHLDDHAGYQPDQSFRQAVLDRGRRRLRRRRLAVSGATAVVALVAATGGLVGYLNWKTGQIRRVDVGAALAPKATAGAPYNVLLVGTDHGTDPSLGPRQDVVGVRADAIILVRIDEAADAVKFLPIPRDLWVGPNEKLGDTFSRGGPEAIVQAVTATLHVPVTHYVGMDMDGLRDLVDAVGGVRVSTAQPLADTSSGFTLSPGCTTLDGRQTVALSRSRHMFNPTRRVPDGYQDPDTGDLGRIEINRVLALALLQSFQRMGADPVLLNHLLDVVLSRVVVDSSWSRSDLLNVARVLHGSDWRGREQDLLTVVAEQRGGVEGLRLDERSSPLPRFGAPAHSVTNTSEGRFYGTDAAFGLVYC